MAENYTKAQRNKRDFDRTMKIIQRETRRRVHLIDNAKQEVGACLMDLQSKTKNLDDTITFITTKLIEEKREAEEQLKRMSIERHTHNLKPEGASDMSTIQKRILTCKEKLEWLNPQRPTLKKHMNVADLITSKKQGFGAMLSKMRGAKANIAQEVKEESESEEEEDKPPSPNELCSLIDHFKTLPKIYPSKPRKKRPKKTAVLLNKYAKKKQEREEAMSYVTRRRLRRAELHSDTLKDLFLTSTKPEGKLIKTSLRPIGV